MEHPTGNGGFPLPAPGGAERLVESSHAACSGRTRVRLPAALPTRAVRRVVCDNCKKAYDAGELVEVQPERRRRIDARWLTLPLAALAVFTVLTLVRDGGKPPSTGSPVADADTTGSKASKAPDGGGKAKKSAVTATTSKPPVPTDAQLVAESTFALALPAGWDRVAPASGATFAAVSPDSTADATLWVQNDPTLDMAAFEANSLQQLEVLAGSARVVERDLGPMPEQSSITLAPKSAAEGSPAYEVVLRAAGDNWFYLATSTQPEAPAEAVAGVDLIQGSFVAQGGKP